MSASIDYGLGRTNIDHATGIRYGCISMHSVAQAWADSSEPDYGEPTCPRCGDSVADTSGHGDDEYEQYERGCCADYVCHSCKHTLDSADVFPEEPLGYTFDDGDYLAQDCLDSDILIIKSPYYTYAPFCSPCVPGAGNLDDAADIFVAGVLDYPRVYCFSHDWFDDGRAPYRVFRVSDDGEVFPTEEDV